METIIEKLNKIKNLAEKGIAGEALAAKRALENLLKKYNLTMEDLTNDIKKVQCFTAKNTNERAVFLMCCFKIIGADRSQKIYNYKGKSNTLYLELTDYEYAEISQFYEFHRKNINKEFKIMISTFQQAYQCKHDLYSFTKIEHPKELTVAEIIKIRQLASTMEDVTFYKAIKQSN